MVDPLSYFSSHSVLYNLYNKCHGGWDGAYIKSSGESGFIFSLNGLHHMSDAYNRWKPDVGSIPHGGPIELFLVPASAPRLV